MDLAVLVGWIANVLTIIAAGIALSGVLATWLSRPRLELSAHATGSSGVMISLLHQKGSAPAKNIFLGWGAGVGDDGIAMMGDGHILWASILVPGAGLSLTVHDPDNLRLMSEPSQHETRLQIGSSGGFVAKVSWQRTLVPWLRTNRVVIWTNKSRNAGLSPEVLSGRAGLRIYNEATRPPST